MRRFDVVQRELVKAFEERKSLTDQKVVSLSQELDDHIVTLQKLKQKSGCSNLVANKLQERC
ncbi:MULTISPECIES: aspartyl-phosphate phosphatase Spo0E family protein [Paenibacillus]|uniref:Aspartyl-phosphate phosphatase Spo0E family protein n=1 Tax=Paenibacillus arenosi TaxID=2774142 RepID=A0ABR9AVH2_9BACL|nr:aspartyl-phosphate phosphatase Spo0E family protein [Paenibacillus agilis]MBD8497227.1 aspartyl-phosphate phosphatase Spo0E family protein [Paenibacillus arenosi]